MICNLFHISIKFLDEPEDSIFVIEQVPVSELSSWESSRDEDLSEKKPNLKHSKGVMNLSKFLSSSEEEVDDDETKKKVEKIYDSVDNLSTLIPNQDEKRQVVDEKQQSIDAPIVPNTSDKVSEVQILNGVNYRALAK